MVIIEDDSLRYVVWSQSQPETLHGDGLASDFVAVATLLFYYFKNKKSSSFCYKIENKLGKL